MPEGNTKRGAAAVAAGIVEGDAPREVGQWMRALEDEHVPTATEAARVVEELVRLAPNLAAPHIERLVRLLASEQPRVVRASATTLPELARVAPAKVARHLPKLREAFDHVTDIARDGIVRTFVSLCLASVAYQRRLIDILQHALTHAPDKMLVQWSEIVLPALKGEPHAEAREVVEARIPSLPRPLAQKVAKQLGIALRPSNAP